MKRRYLLSTLTLALAVLAGSLDAQTWEPIALHVPVPIRADQRALDTDGSRLYVLVSRGIYMSADNGDTFQPLNDVEGNVYSMTNLPGRFIKYVNGSMWVGFDPGSAALGGTGPINYGAASLHRLTPGESVWHKSSNGFPIGDTGNQADDITYDVSTGTYYAGAALGGAFVSTDGLNWTQRTAGLGGLGLPVSMVAFDGIAFELRPLAQVYRSLNRGTNWTALASHQGISSGFMLEQNGRLMFASSGNNTLQDGFNYSDDHGATWTFTTTLRGTADLSQRDGIIYAAGLCGGITETAYGRYGVKFSATAGITWDNLPTNGLPIDSFSGINVTRIVRQGNFLFLYSGTNLFRCDVSGFDFRPTTQIVRQMPAVSNILSGQNLNLNVLAGGANLTYQWLFQGTNLPGATQATLSLPAVQTNQSGAYRLIVTGDRGSITSSAVAVTVSDWSDGHYDLTYLNPLTGGSIYLLTDSSLISVGGAPFYKMNPAGDRAITRTISGATLPANMLDSSNRIIMGGNFTTAPKGNRLIRVFGNDLTDDTNYHVLNANGSFSTITELPGRGYLVGGSFTSVTNVGTSTNSVGYMCLVGYSGLVDTSFSVGTGPSGPVSKIVVEGTTNIYVSGVWTVWNGASSYQFVKLRPDGSLDTGFSHTATANNLTFFQPAMAGKLFGVVSLKPVLLNPDGTLDPAFNTANATIPPGSVVKSIAVGQSNQLYVVGTFASYGGKSVGEYMRLSSSGILDTNFYTQSPTSGGFSWDVFDPRGYLYLVRDTSSGTFQGQSFGTGPYRLFTGTGPAANAGAPTFDQWTAQYTFPPGLSHPEDDADGDGIKNIFEYYFGSNPTDRASGSQPVSARVQVVGEDYPAITFIRSKTATGISVIPQVSSSLLFNDSLGSTLESVVAIDAQTERVTIRSNVRLASQTAQFLRLQLSIP